MNPKVFREYDIRGIVDVDIRDEDVVLLGKAFGTYMSDQGKRFVAVGRDCRLSSERYRQLLTEGMLATGMDVVDLGMCPTPLLYFALRHLDREGGIMITASHNPPEYNGFKVCNGPDTISGAEIQKLRQIMEGGSFALGTGRLQQVEIIAPYQDFVVKNIQLDRKLRVGVDAGNATGGPIAVPVLQELGCDVFPLYCEPDGTFPN
ncbi:MAG: phosphomannomutase, partial [Syntrophobacteraceae bacterium]|nr:phosphomannomutase [Syntrophobacteraceae bacterium]